jgi:hypothetical protein
MVPGAALRFTRLGAQGFWFDEGNTALLVHMSPGRMLGLIPQSEVHALSRAFTATTLQRDGVVVQR